MPSPLRAQASSTVQPPRIQSPRRKAPTASDSKSKSKPIIQTLPTPPRTRKRKRGGRSPGTSGAKSDSDHDDRLAIDSDRELNEDSRGRAKNVEVVGHKKRKMSKLDALAEQLARQAEEDAFWGAGPSIKPSPPTASKSTDTPQTRGRTLSRSPTRSPSSSPPAHLLRRTRSGLLSPPPSRRQAVPIVFPVTPPPRVRTPPKKALGDGVSKKLFPERDSPNNPFLLSGKGSPDDVPGSSSPEPHTPQRYVEKPTITYVFRGVKGVFENPLYDPSHPDGVPSPTPDSPSLLPEADPDFSPTPYCPPKLLFPEARRHNHARSRRKRPVTNRDGSPTPTPKANRLSNRKSKPIARNTASEWDTSDEEDGDPAAKEERADALRRMGGATVKGEGVSKVSSKPVVAKAASQRAKPSTSGKK